MMIKTHLKTVVSEVRLRVACALEPEHAWQYVRIPSTADVRDDERSRF